ncbi:MAG TPA: alkaline phosphatase D family protein [Acidimicrobiales bacterium]|nr:alkaline phosphatase D family protein [Acidimicrobiales bacterium]
MPELTRRRFLQAASASATAVLVGPAIAGRPARAAAGSFLHGVASGDPLPDRVILWTRVTPPVNAPRSLSVQWVVATDPELRRVVARGHLSADATRDWTVKVDAGGLRPRTTYYYGFRSRGEESPVGRTRTAPAGAIDRIRLAVVTCGDFNRGLFHAYGRVAERNDLDAVVHLGDYIYEHGRQDRVRPHVPATELRTLPDYRARYASYRLDPHLAALHRNHPVIWVWDDHETANNAWSGGAGGHDPGQDGDYGLRKAAALGAALEWLPIRSPDPAAPERIYRRLSFGDLADLMMLDTRRIGRDKPEPGNVHDDYFRQVGAFVDPRRHLLGARQERWLTEQLRSSRATWKLIGNQVVFSPIKLIGAPDATGLSVYANPDQWDGYAPARDRIVAAIKGGPGGKPVGDVVFLTGDVHASFAFEVATDPNNPLAYDPTTGDGAIATELVAPSISSASDPGSIDPTDPPGAVERLALEADHALRLPNPHLKYIESKLNGYLLVDVDRERVRAEFWHVPFVGRPTDQQTMSKALLIPKGQARLADA